MSTGQRRAAAIPIEDFLQALGAQLDRAQDVLALKVRTGRPLTWALKDISLDIQVFVEQDAGGRIHWRHAASNEQGASRINLTFTTITRTMVEENTLSSELESDPRGLDELRAAGKISEEEQRRLEWAGIRTTGQLKRVSSETDPRTIQQVVGLPMEQLRAALLASARPTVTGHEVVAADDDGPPLVRLYGANLSKGARPEVRMNGEPVEVIEAKDHRLVVRPLAHHREGEIEVRIGGERATGFVRLPQRAAPAPAPTTAAPEARS